MRYQSYIFRACNGGSCPLPASPPRPPPLLPIGTYPEKVILIICVQFSTYFYASGNSDTKQGRFSSKTSRKSSYFAHFKSISMLHKQRWHLFCGQHLLHLSSGPTTQGPRPIGCGQSDRKLIEPHSVFLLP